MTLVSIRWVQAERCRPEQRFGPPSQQSQEEESLSHTRFHQKAPYKETEEGAAESPGAQRKESSGERLADAAGSHKGLPGFNKVQ